SLRSYVHRLSMNRAAGEACPAIPSLPELRTTFPTGLRSELLPRAALAQRLHSEAEQPFVAWTEPALEIGTHPDRFVAAALHGLGESLGRVPAGEAEGQLQTLRHADALDGVRQAVTESFELGNVVRLLPDLGEQAFPIGDEVRELHFRHVCRLLKKE